MRMNYLTDIGDNILSRKEIDKNDPCLFVQADIVIGTEILRGMAVFSTSSFYFLKDRELIFSLTCEEARSMKILNYVETLQSKRYRYYIIAMLKPKVSITFKCYKKSEANRVLNEIF